MIRTRKLRFRLSQNGDVRSIKWRDWNHAGTLMRLLIRYAVMTLLWIEGVR